MSVVSRNVDDRSRSMIGVETDGERTRMREERTRHTVTAVLLVAAVIAVIAPGLAPPVAGAAADRLRINFDGVISATELGNKAPVADSSGQGNNGVVRVAHGGRVVSVSDATGTVADFPNACKNEPCPNALIEIADRASLDPGTAPFQWGARILLKKSETADGENVLQKGTWGQPGGQWKLQIDKAAGVPSCVVSGAVPGTNTERRVVLKAARGVADGTWHTVMCRRTASGLEILIDGVVRGSKPMPAVVLDSAAPVTIGAKSVKPADNDQFQGMLDDVFMTVL
jgi:hypothetical protein